MSCALLKKGEQYTLVCKGAPDFLIKSGMQYLTESGEKDLNDEI